MISERLHVEFLNELFHSGIQVLFRHVVQPAEKAQGLSDCQPLIELGISRKVHQQKQSVSKVEANKLSVRQELQADCLAGVWGYHADRAKQMLEQGDLEEALVAAQAIGDDRLQKQSRGYVTPESFTHGSSAQRLKWFKRGMQSGQFNQCDTFSLSDSQL